MRNLETSLKLKIFERSQRTPKLTEVGLSLVSEASMIIAAYDGLADRVRSDNDISGDLILGAVPTTLTGLLPLALSQLKIQHPALQIRVVPGLSNQLLLQLDRGQIHAAVISRPEVLSHSLSFSKIATEALVLLVSPLTKQLSPDELLRSQPFIRFNRDAVVGRQIEAWLQGRGISVRDTMELEGLEAISSMVAANLGISIVPKRCITESDQLPLKTISLGKNAPTRTLGLVSLNNTPKIRIIAAAETALLKAVELGSPNYTSQ
jgi:DNA-binding transcriptional LysR family regulator